MKKLIRILPLLCLVFLTSNNVSAQDDVMDEGDYYEPEARPAETYEAPMADEYYDEAPPVDSEEYLPPTGDVPAYNDAGPSTPTEAIKDFKDAQEDRLDQLDSFDEDY